MKPLAGVFRYLVFLPAKSLSDAFIQRSWGGTRFTTDQVRLFFDSTVGAKVVASYCGVVVHDSLIREFSC